MHCIYDGQFIVTKADINAPPGFVVHRLDQWQLAAHSTLPVTQIFDASSRHIGWIVGHFIDYSKRIINSNAITLKITRDMESALKASTIEQFLYLHAGRFIAIILDNNFKRLYLDSFGSLSAVYRLDSRTVASTPALACSESYLAKSFDSQLHSALQIPVASSGWYPAGLTPYEGVSRLLPNHYLDLESNDAVRHWPNQSLVEIGDTDALARKIASALKAIIETVATNNRVYMSLTAGRDSRLLLACARQLQKQVNFFTFTRPADTVDECISRIAEARYGLNVSYFPIETSSAIEQQAWLDSVGHCVGGEIHRIHATLRQLPSPSIILPGFGGEIARAYLWHRRDHSKMHIDAALLLDRFGMPRHKKLIAAMSDWLEGVPDTNALNILDLAYIEQRLGCWGGPQTYGQIKYADHLYPICCREIIEAMLCLPEEYKRQSRLFSDVFRLEWPDLLDMPINEYPDSRKYKALVLRYASGIRRRANKLLSRSA